MWVGTESFSMKPQGKVKIKWSPEFAYAIGLITSDGSLSKDGRHISFVSKDIEMIKNFQRSLDFSCKVGKKSSGSNKNKIYKFVQIGDVSFYNFLISIGLMPNKSKVVGSVKVPKKYFFHFLRGCFDGDGSFYSYYDKRWKSSLMFYVSLASASKTHILWLRAEILKRLKIKGHIAKSLQSSAYQLRYAKQESLKLLSSLYLDDTVSLSRKKLKILKVIKSKKARVV